ncbi:hypothetical protein [Streptomyces sp. NBC_01727]|uniref:hypothetical protein n=1 Tax=Streptomyces sp. NBC_01727 TaxID=2975924 RepID=UPI002E0F87AF|nr:hypothetical protein OIE76_43580 [Streptomyces sp. NBC_01727]
MTSGRYRSSNLICQAGATEAEEQAERCAESLGWPCRGEIPADPDQGIPYEVQWWAGPGLILHFLVDDLSGSAAVCVSGDSRDVVEAAVELVKSQIPFNSFEGLRNAVDTAVGSMDAARALIRAAIGAPQDFDDGLFSRVGSLLFGADPVLQEAAVWAVSYAPWPEFRAVLREFLSVSSDERLVLTARTVLEGFELERIPEA